MKKLVFALLAVGGAVLIKKKLDEGRGDRTLWEDATDTVQPGQ